MFELTTDRLILRPLRLDDAQDMFAYAKDPEVTKYVSWEPHRSVEDSKTFIRFLIAQDKPTPIEALGIFLKEKPDKVIGTVGIKRRSHAFEGELAYALARPYWRKGYMFEVGTKLIEKAFLDYNYERVFASCAKENIASKSMMKKLGMQYEGCLRSRAFAKGQFWDVEFYSILKSEWDFLKSNKKENLNQDYQISYVQTPSPEDIKTLGAGITEHARLKKGLGPTESFGFFIRDEKDRVIAGCSGFIFYGCLYTDLLWVTEKLRGNGIGKKLLEAVEQLAKSKKCSMVTINTMDWQALDLYKKVGYRVDLERRNYNNNSTFYFLKKDLVVYT